MSFLLLQLLTGIPLYHINIFVEYSSFALISNDIYLNHTFAF